MTMKLSNLNLFRLLAVGSTVVLVGGITMAANADTTQPPVTTATISTIIVPPTSPRPSISSSIGSESDDATDNAMDDSSASAGTGLSVSGDDSSASAGTGLSVSGGTEDSNTQSD